MVMYSRLLKGFVLMLLMVGTTKVSAGAVVIVVIVVITVVDVGMFLDCEYAVVAAIVGVFLLTDR